MLGLKKKWERRIRKKLEGKSLKEIQKVRRLLFIAYALSLIMLGVAIVIPNKMPRLKGLCIILLLTLALAGFVTFCVTTLILIPVVITIYNELEKIQQTEEETERSKKQVKTILSETFKEVVYWPHVGDEVLMRCAKELKQTTIRHARIAADGVEILVLDNKGKVINSYTINSTSFCLNYKIK